MLAYSLVPCTSEMSSSYTVILASRYETSSSVSIESGVMITGALFTGVTYTLTEYSPLLLLLLLVAALALIVVSM